MERDGKIFYYYDPYLIPTYPDASQDDYFERLQEYYRHPLNQHQMMIPFGDNVHLQNEYVQQFTNVQENSPDVVLREAMQTIQDTGQYLETYCDEDSVKYRELNELRNKLDKIVNHGSLICPPQEPDEDLVIHYKKMIHHVLHPEEQQQEEMDGVEEF